MEGPSLDIDDLADELLNAQRGDPDSDKEDEPAPKPGSKKYLIDQIGKICEASGVPQEESHRELTRLSRGKLKELVTEYVTKAEKKRLADTVGAQSSCDAVVAVTMLRMAHDTVFKIAEPTVDSLAISFTGLTLEGFTENLRHEPQNQQLNEVLKELIRDNPDILGWASNPWARLGLIYAQTAAFTARRYIPDHQTNAAEVGRATGSPHGGGGNGPHDHGGPENWEELHVRTPSPSGSVSEV
jgi:hypothetical protein